MSNLRFSFIVGLVTFIVWSGTGLFFNPSITVPLGAGKLSALETLGEALFHDRALSEPPGLSCAGCHDGRLQRQSNNKSTIPSVAKGSREGVFGRRNTPTTLYSSLTPPFEFRLIKDQSGKELLAPFGGLFLDGRAATLEEQTKGPMFNDLEMNNASPATLVEKLRHSPSSDMFVSQFGDIYGQPELVVEKIGLALAAYERTPEFFPFASKFDKVLRGEQVFSTIEQEGFRLFANPQKGNCISCHVGIQNSKNPRDWLFTDFSYDVLAVPRNRATPFNSEPRHYDLGLCMQPGITLRVPKGVDLSELCGAFKVPTLRNVAVTGPYFHNGAISTLRDAVAFYATRDVDPARWYKDGVTFDDLPERYWKNVNRTEVPYDIKPGQQPRLNDHEIDAIVAFLETLTDPQGD